MLEEWEILNRELSQDYRLFQVHQKQVRSPRTGDRLTVQTIQTRDWVLVIPVTPEEEVIMMRQYRHGAEKICLELPGGLVDTEDTSPIIAAERELLEETGCQGTDLAAIGECYPQPAVLTNKCFFYLARNVKKIREPDLDAGEDIEIVKFPLREISAKIENQEIVHGMVQLGFFFYWMKQERAGFRS